MSLIPLCDGGDDCPIRELGLGSHAAHFKEPEMDKLRTDEGAGGTPSHAFQAYRKVEQPPKLAKGRCWLRHKWTMWTDSERLHYTNSRFNRENQVQHQEIEPVQERTCLRCGITQVRKFDEAFV